MKKALTIGGIVLGVLLVGALVIFIFFPGLFTYIKVKHKYENIDRTIGSFETVDVPSSFNTYTLKGLKISVPEDLTRGDTGGAFRDRDGNIAVLITESDHTALKEYAELMGETYDQWEYYEYTETEYRSYFRAVGHEYPSIYDASTDIIWYLRGGFTAKDCLKLRGADRKVFLEFAEAKNESWGTEDSWELELDGGTAYIAKSANNDLVNYDYWDVTVYPDGGSSKYCFVMLKDLSDEVSRQIISSIKIAE